MSNLKSKWREIAIVILIVICGLSISKCKNNAYWSKQNEKNFHNAENKFNVYKDKAGQEVAIQKQIIVSKQSQIKKLTEKVDSIGELHGQIKIVTVTKIKNVEVPIIQPVYIDTLGNKYLLVPARFALNDKWYGQSGEIKSNGTIGLDSMYFRSEPVISFGNKKRTIKQFLTFKDKEPIVGYYDKNPHVVVEKMQNVFVKNKLSRISLSATVGYGGTVYGLTPYVGLGLSYSLIRF